LLLWCDDAGGEEGGGAHWHGALVFSGKDKWWEGGARVGFEMVTNNLTALLWRQE
jgi:hypothetical protein